MAGGKVTATPSERDKSGNATWNFTFTHPKDGKTHNFSAPLNHQVTTKDFAAGSYLKSHVESLKQPQAKNTAGAAVTPSADSALARNELNDARKGLLNNYKALIGERQSKNPDATTLDRLSRELWGAKSQVDAATTKAQKAGVSVDNDRHFGSTLGAPYSQFGVRLDILSNQSASSSWEAQKRDNGVLSFSDKTLKTGAGFVEMPAHGYVALGKSIADGSLLDAVGTSLNPNTAAQVWGGVGQDTAKFVKTYVKSNLETIKKTTDLPNMTAGQRGEWAFDMAMVALDVSGVGTAVNGARRAAVLSKITVRAEGRLGRELTKAETANIVNGLKNGKAPEAYGQVLKDAKTAGANPKSPAAGKPAASAGAADAGAGSAPKRTLPATLAETFASGSNPRFLTVNPRGSKPIVVEIRTLPDQGAIVGLPDGTFMKFGPQNNLGAPFNAALKKRLGEVGAAPAAAPSKTQGPPDSRPATGPTPKRVATASLAEAFAAGTDARTLTINPAGGKAIVVEIRTLPEGRAIVRLPGENFVTFGPQKDLGAGFNDALKKRFGHADPSPVQAKPVGTNPATTNPSSAKPIQSAKIPDPWNDPIDISTKPPTKPQEQGLVQTPEPPKRLEAGAEELGRKNPKSGEITLASIKAAKSVKAMSAAELREAAEFLVARNPSSYPTVEAAITSLKKADQLYVIRNEAPKSVPSATNPGYVKTGENGSIAGTATLTATGPNSWYLGQVASGPGGFGGDVMSRLLGDFSALAKNEGKPVRIHAYTNKPENVYNPKHPEGKGFYDKHGAKITDPNSAGFRDMTTQRRIDIEWNFGPDGKPVNTPPTRPVGPNPVAGQPPAGNPAANSGPTNQATTTTPAALPSSTVGLAGTSGNPLRPFQPASVKPDFPVNFGASGKPFEPPANRPIGTNSAGGQPPVNNAGSYLPTVPGGPKPTASVGFADRTPTIAPAIPSTVFQQGVTALAGIIDNPLRPFLIPQGVFGVPTN